MDKNNFSDLYSASRKDLYKYCRTLCGNDADDLMQQTYLKAWENFGSFRGENFSFWLRSIARNIFLDNLRKSKCPAEELPEIPDNSNNPEFIAEKRDIGRILLKALKDSLSSVQRITIILYYYDEKSVSEIANIMQVSENTVKSRLFNARKKLREELKKFGNIFTCLSLGFAVMKHRLKNIQIPVNARITVSAVLTAASMALISVSYSPPENKFPDTVIKINETHTSENLTTTEYKTDIQTSSETAFIEPVSHATTKSVYYTMPTKESHTTAFKSEYEDFEESEEDDTEKELTEENDIQTETEEVTTMKKEIISAVTAVTTTIAGMTMTTTAVDETENIVTATYEPAEETMAVTENITADESKTYLYFLKMSDEEFSEYTQDRYKEYGFGDDSIADEIKFKNLLYIVPDFFIGDNYESEDYNIYKIFADGEATAYIPFYVDSETELDRTLSADFFGYPEDWTIQYIDGVGIFGDNIYERVHEYRICIPKEVILDFESYVRLYESRFEIYSNNEKYQKYGITGNTWIDCQFLPAGEYMFFEPVNGDANLDGRMSISDSVAILQNLANSEKYPLSVQGKYNADCDGNDGITGLDAAYIQQIESIQS